VQLDFGDPEFQTDPWELYEWHALNEPVAWSAAMECYFVFGYEVVRSVLMSSSFTSADPFRRTRIAIGPSMLDVDGGVHSRLRGALSPQFKREAISRYADDMTPIVRGSCEAALASGDPRWASRLAASLPIRIATHVLGLPDGDAETLAGLAEPLVLFIDHGAVPVSKVVSLRDELREYFRAAVRASPRLGSVLATMVEDHRLSDDDVIDHAVLLLVAATETTSCAITNVLARVAWEPGILNRLRGDTALGRAVVTETLRHEPPLHFTLRYVDRDVDVAGIHLPAGAPVQVCLASANRDPRVHPRPGMWDERRRAIFLTFGSGRHHCLGSPLAEFELETLLQELAHRIEDLWVVAPADPRPSGRTFRRVRDLELGVGLRLAS
jgi:cytochrome P450